MSGARVIIIIIIIIIFIIISESLDRIKYIFEN